MNFKQKHFCQRPFVLKGHGHLGVNPQVRTTHRHRLLPVWFLFQRLNPLTSDHERGCPTGNWLQEFHPPPPKTHILPPPPTSCTVSPLCAVLSLLSGGQQPAAKGHCWGWGHPPHGAQPRWPPPLLPIAPLLPRNLVLGFVLPVPPHPQ